LRLFFTFQYFKFNYFLIINDNCNNESFWYNYSLVYIFGEHLEFLKTIADVLFQILEIPLIIVPEIKGAHPFFFLNQRNHPLLRLDSRTMIDLRFQRIVLNSLLLFLNLSLSTLIILEALKLRLDVQLLLLILINKDLNS
jgi:hypothetical protein